MSNKYVLGSIGAVVMEHGMSLIMIHLRDILGTKHTNVSSSIVGIISILMIIANFPFYRVVLITCKKEYVLEILKLSEQIISNP